MMDHAQHEQSDQENVARVVDRIQMMGHVNMQANPFQHPDIELFRDKVEPAHQHERA